MKNKQYFCKNLTMKKDLIKIEQLQQVLPENPSIQTIYQWTSKDLIPHYKIGRTLFFSASEIEKWNNSGRPKNNSQTDNI